MGAGAGPAGMDKDDVVWVAQLKNQCIGGHELEEIRTIKVRTFLVPGLRFFDCLGWEPVDDPVIFPIHDRLPLKVQEMFAGDFLRTAHDIGKIFVFGVFYLLFGKNREHVVPIQEAKKGPESHRHPCGGIRKFREPVGGGDGEDLVGFAVLLVLRDEHVFLGISLMEQIPEIEQGFVQ